MYSSLKRSDMARDNNGITQFNLPPTNEPYLPLLPSRRASTPFGWYRGTHRGMARLSLIMKVVSNNGEGQVSTSDLVNV